jgi:hypothetical protein
MPLSKDEVPAFARGFPDDPRLEALVLAFKQGNYAKVRSAAPDVVREAENLDVKRAAEELVKRTKADPLMVWLLVLTGLLLLTLSAYWTTRG